MSTPKSTKTESIIDSPPTGMNELNDAPKAVKAVFDEVRIPRTVSNQSCPCREDRNATSKKWNRKTDHIESTIGATRQEILEFARSIPEDSCTLPGDAKVDISLSLIASIPGSYTGPASRAYLYYTDENKLWVDGMKSKLQLSDTAFNRSTSCNAFTLS